ncbi:hypothetical protein DI487_01840 [Flavobacterium sediminis]|uniref:Lipoprotein n=1 Tax=Flavobacterium sediminis TaxID=2201181 RepID=A0A2U8QSD2_9FLAO|nr:hypothetical protein [Flavobacterium sediminis]AWM12734.1 hypothetical protein DI487_01840 [Flavobacterium sediminis]
MKNLLRLTGSTVFAIIMIACTDKENKISAQKIDNFTKFVDSISSVSINESSEKWKDIEATYQMKKNEAEQAITKIDNKVTAQENIDASTTKFDLYKSEVTESKMQMEKKKLRKALLGEEHTGEDLTFSWVNKDNILQVYENFVNTVEQNKALYSREDWDEIKLLYEALDSRKNTIEKEGLSSDDNLKIAALKVKFAPMYTLNRMNAKAEENAEAKE